MHVLSKPEFDGCVRLDELSILLENFGVQKLSKESSEIF